MSGLVGSFKFSTFNQGCATTFRRQPYNPLMTNKRPYYILFLIPFIVVSCNQKSYDTSEIPVTSSDVPNEYSSVVPEFHETDLIKLFHETEEGGAKKPQYAHLGVNRFQIADSTFDELLIEYDQTNLQIHGDSLASFIIKSTSILKPEQRIVYDFGVIPGNYGDINLSGASYSRQQLNERWYFEEIGFD